MRKKKKLIIIKSVKAKMLNFSSFSSLVYLKSNFLFILISSLMNVKIIKP